MQSIQRLIFDGFEEDAVQFLPESALQDTNIIVEILKDTHRVRICNIHILDCC